MVFTRAEVEQRSGIPTELADRLWRALGFVSTADGERAFTEDDVAALRLMGGLAADGLVGEDEGVTLARTTGAVMSRLAEATAAAVVRGLRSTPTGADETDTIAAFLPLVDRLERYVFRRHLLGALMRSLAGDGTGSRPLAVGFCDLVGYTTLSRHLDEPTLLRLVERLEEVASDVVTSNGGRVVKTVGDGILFTVEDPGAGAATTLELTARGGRDGLPEIHAGLAHGGVLVHQGDVVGPVVNLASRLTSLARPGTVLVDDGAAAALAGDARWRLRALRPQRVRGYDHLVAHVLRRAMA